MDISVIFKLAAIGIVITVVCQVLKKSDRDDIRDGRPPSWGSSSCSPSRSP